MEIFFLSVRATCTREYKWSKPEDDTKKVVVNILCGEGRPTPYSIFGPPNDDSGEDDSSNLLGLWRLVSIYRCHSPIVRPTYSLSSIFRVTTSVSLATTWLKKNWFRLSAPYCYTVNIAMERTIVNETRKEAHNQVWWHSAQLFNIWIGPRAKSFWNWRSTWSKMQKNSTMMPWISENARPTICNKIDSNRLPHYFFSLNFFFNLKKILIIRKAIN